MKKTTRKKPGPKPTGKGETVGVRILPDLMKALDKHVARTGSASRPAAIRDIVADRLKAEGLLK